MTAQRKAIHANKLHNHLILCEYLREVRPKRSNRKNLLLFLVDAWYILFTNKRNNDNNNSVLQQKTTYCVSVLWRSISKAALDVKCHLSFSNSPPNPNVEVYVIYRHMHCITGYNSIQRWLFFLMLYSLQDVTDFVRIQCYFYVTYDSVLVIV